MAKYLDSPKRTMVKAFMFFIRPRRMFSKPYPTWISRKKKLELLSQILKLNRFLY